MNYKDVESFLAGPDFSDNVLKQDSEVTHPYDLDEGDDIDTLCVDANVSSKDILEVHT